MHVHNTSSKQNSMAESSSLDTDSESSVFEAALRQLVSENRERCHFLDGGTALQFDGIQRLEQSDAVIITLPSNSAVAAQPLRYFMKTMRADRLLARAGKEGDDWTQNIHSWSNEIQFYANVSACATAFTNAGIRVPRLVAASAVERGADTAAVADHTREFTIVLEYLSRAEHDEVKTLGESRSFTLVRALARFHGLFWDAVAAPTDPYYCFAELWRPLGAWWREARRPSVESTAIVPVFVSLCAAFLSLRDLDCATNRDLLGTLCARRSDISTALATARPRCIIHGDVKTSNLFFCGDGDVVTLFDFQWAGLAPSGAADLAYVVLGGINMHEFDLDDGGSLGIGELRLLRAYYDELCAAIALRGAAAVDFTFEHLLHHYKLETLDHLCTAVPFLLVDLTPALLSANARKHGWLTYEFDARALRWALRRLLFLANELDALLLQ